MRSAGWLALLLTLATAACSANSTAPQGPDLQTADPVVVQAGETLVLHVGEVGSIAGTTIRIGFAGVLNDSRCPVDVTCVWEGNAEVRLGFAEAGSGTDWRLLDTTGQGRTTDYGGYRVRIVQLRPSMDTRTELDPADYEVELGIERV